MSFSQQTIQKGGCKLKTIQLGGSPLAVPAAAVGCMRINQLDAAGAEHFIRHCLDLGANFFDHADIYGGGGACESLFGDVLRQHPGLRDKMILQTKCGIVPGVMFDFSKEHIISAVEGSLQRLGTSYLDVLLLHRPDTLMEPEEVAEAFESLHAAGKVRYFGVSNQNPWQMQLLQKHLGHKLVADQLQFGPAHASMISAGLEVNMATDGAVNRDGGVLEYCRLHDITIQAWSPFQYGFFGGVYLGSEKYPELNKVIDEIAEKYGVTNTAIVTAWILRHPARMQMISGTMKESRMDEIVSGTGITLTREEWYRIYLAAGNILP